jgi:transcriptional regulator with XRE-family HTH domain
MPIEIDLYINRRYITGMMEISFKTPEELQSLLGARLRKLRLSRNIDQRATADKAGISEKALRNLESGHGSTVGTLIRTLKALDSLDGIEMLAPEPGVDPLALLHSPKPPQRVRRSRKLRSAKP